VAKQLADSCTRHRLHCIVWSVTDRCLHVVLRGAASSITLATPGAIQADFTPPEERVLREKRRVRKVGIVMAAGCGVLVLAAGVLGTQKLSQLEDERTLLEQRRDIVRADKRELDRVNADLARVPGSPYSGRRPRACATT
jgi:hypothetical protein